MGTRPVELDPFVFADVAVPTIAPDPEVALQDLVPLGPVDDRATHRLIVALLNKSFMDNHEHPRINVIVTIDGA